MNKTKEDAEKTIITDDIIRKTVLVVDDNPSILISVQVILEDAGYTVITADSGKACIEVLKSGFSGIILLDIMMSGMDGWDTIVAIKKEHLDSNILIVMLTAKSNPGEKMIGLEDYVFDYITKPFKPEELVNRVNKYSEYIQK
jgi:DNA-binding response OmpR family regulator